MRATTSVAFALCLALTSAARAGDGDGDQPHGPGQEPPQRGPTQCAKVYAEARMEAYGYTHVLVLDNQCSQTVTCEAWTDVDPEPKVTLVAGSKAKVEHITRRGSPARAVTAHSECRFAK